MLLVPALRAIERSNAIRPHHLSNLPTEAEFSRTVRVMDLARFIEWLGWRTANLNQPSGQTLAFARIRAPAPETCAPAVIRTAVSATTTRRHLRSGIGACPVRLMRYVTVRATFLRSTTASKAGAMTRVAPTAWFCTRGSGGHNATGRKDAVGWVSAAGSASLN